MSRAASLDAHLEAAIDWLVLMRSGTASAEDRRRFEAWRDAAPEHARAWGVVAASVDEPFAPLQPADRAAAGAALRRPATRRRFLGSSLGGAAGIIILGAAASRLPWRAWTADLRTGTGERRAYVLDDGSELVLNAQSAVDLAFESGVRRLRLLSGSVLAKVAADPSRPFIVATPDGEVRALGTVFMASRDTGSSLAVVLEHAVEVSAGGQRRVLQSGMGLRFGPDGVGEPDPRLADRAAWRGGMLVARDEPLGQVIEALRPYRPGLLRISPEAARLRVLGAFPLDQPDRALASLAQTLPIRVAFYGRWLATVDVAPEESPHAVP